MGGSDGESQRKRRRTRTLLRSDLLLRKEVNAQDDQVGQDVQPPNEHQNLRVLEWNLLGQLHHHKDDSHIGSTSRKNQSVKVTTKE